MRWGERYISVIMPTPKVCERKRYGRAELIYLKPVSLLTGNVFCLRM